MIANKDLAFVKDILPKHYTVKESNTAGCIHCVSHIGIKESDQEGDKSKKWHKVIRELRKHFGDRFNEVYHNVNLCHMDFTIFLKSK